jgi:hypothetical protein
VTLRDVPAGTNSVLFAGRLSRTRSLSPGRYQMTLVATDAAGNRSAATTAELTAVGRTR